LNRKRLVANPILSGAFKQNMRLLGIMHMESWSTARMRLSDYEGERFKPVLVTRQAVCELAR
jgi:hypothetical protein